jgi:hypothetical protein
MPEIVRRARAREASQSPESSALRFGDSQSFKSKFEMNEEAKQYAEASNPETAFSQWAAQPGGESENVEYGRAGRFSMKGRYAPFAGSSMGGTQRFIRREMSLRAAEEGQLSRELGVEDIGRSSLDRGLASESGIDAKGNLDVNVRAPAGTEVRAEGDGMFKGNVTTNRQIDLPTLQ